MTNLARGAVTFEAGGKTYTLTYSTNAFCEIEQATSRSIKKIGMELLDPDNLTINTLRTVVWGGLREHHPEITFADAGRLIDQLGMTNMLTLVLQAVAAAFPAAAEVASPLATAAGPTTNGAGKKSSRSGARSAAIPSSSGA